MELQRRNCGDNYWNLQSNWGFLMESPPHSRLMQPLCGGSGGGGLGFIEHTVTKFDTLAGVAIKYGVEVADIKRMNGLTTDLQMFARKTLHIPLPGRHPPSPIMSNGYDTHGPRKSETTPPNRRRSDMFDSIKSLKLSSSSPQTISPSMDALRDYYGLKPANQNGTSERFGSGAYQKAGPKNIEHGPEPPQSSNPPIGLHRKCKSLANGMSEQGDATNGDGPVANGKKPDSDTWYDKLMRRRLSDVNLQTHTPEKLLKPDTNNTTNTTSAFSAAAGKGLALRPKAASRTANDSDGLQNMPPIKLGGSSISDASGVKKSSSSPSFYDSYNNGNGNGNNGTSISSIWQSSVLNLTVELQALSSAAMTRPIFDGLPKPMSGRKSKAAID
ncbi:putative LysM domain-containing protein [Helianthus annuus]|nr:putative LysM domain-containing protein [Helianthus annuus]